VSWLILAGNGNRGLVDRPPAGRSGVPSRAGTRGISRGGVGRSFVFWVFGFTAILDISVVSVTASLIGNDLNTAIGKYDAVTIAGYFATAAPSVRVVAAVVITGGPVEGVRLRGL
jgi:hypothetical protein